MTVKIARAFFSREEEKDRLEEYYSYDDKTSAFIVYNGLIEVSAALLKLADEKSLSEIKSKLIKLASKAFKISDIIPEEFSFDVKKSKN